MELEREGDRPIWVPGKTRQYSCEAWNSIRKGLPKVKWWKLIWFLKTILKHAFIRWLTIQIGLSTKNHLLQWVPMLILYHARAAPRYVEGVHLHTLVCLFFFFLIETVVIFIE